MLVKGIKITSLAELVQRLSSEQGFIGSLPIRCLLRTPFGLLFLTIIILSYELFNAERWKKVVGP